MYVSSFIVKFSTPLSPLSPSEAPKGGVRCTKYVLRRCVLCICRLKKNVWEVAWKNIFVLLANCLECARALVLGAICIQCALRLTPPPPPSPISEGWIRRGLFPRPFWRTMHSNIVNMLAAWETSAQPCWQTVVSILWKWLTILELHS